MRKNAVVFIVFVALAVPVMFPLAGMAQSKQDALRIHKEAYALKEKARSNDDLKQALQKYEEAIRIYQRVGEQKLQGMAYNSAGLIYADWGQYAKAVEYYEKDLAICRKLGDLKGEGSSLNNLGIVYKNWGQCGKAVEYYDKSLAICRKLGDLKGEGASLTNLGNVYMYLSRYAKAVEYYEKSLAIHRKRGDLKVEAMTLGNLGSVHKYRGQYQKALEMYEKSAEIARKLYDQQTEGNALSNLGLVYKDWGQYAKAVEYYEKSVTIYRKLGDLQGEEISLNNLGNVYSNWGRYQQAVELYKKSSEMARKLGDPKNEGNALNNLGVVYQNWGKYAKALAYYEKSLAIYRRLGDLNGEGSSLNNLGKVYAQQGDPCAALKTYEQTLGIYQKIGVPTGWTKGYMAGAYLEQGNFDKAEPLLKEANLDVYWGRFFLLKGDHAKAKEYYQKIQTFAEKSRNVDGLFTGSTGLGLSCEGMGAARAAAENYQCAVNLVEVLRSSLNESERETFFEVKVNGFCRTAPYEGLARVLTKMNKPLEALKQSEYLKARLFAEAVSKRGGYTGADVPKETRDRDTTLTNELAALSKNLQKAYEKGNKEVIASLEPQVKAAKDKLDAHVTMLRDTYPLFAATKYPQPMDLSQTGIKPDEWVLSYDVGDPGFIVYLTKGKELKKAQFKPVTRKELDTLVRKFIEPLDIKPGEDIGAEIKRFDFNTGKKLADILLSDILTELPKDTPLIVVPADCLGVLPFEMLTLNDSGKIVEKNEIPNTAGAEFLADRNPISYYQSITALTLARNFSKQKGSGNKLLVMCDPVFSPDDPRAKESAAAQRQEVLSRATKDLMACAQTQNGLIWKRMSLTRKLGEDLQKTYPNVTDVFEGLKATKAAFKQQDLTKYQAIVFGTHGYAGMDLGGLKEPVLVLTLVNQPEGEDGFLRQSEVMGLKMNADVVALTACQSGLGRRISGEGTMGMGRAFQYAGAKSVLMTLWSVAQKSSVDMTDSFFRHLKAGKPKLEALRLARDEIRKNGYDHPFFWAPFILVGEVQ